MPNENPAPYDFMPKMDPTWDYGDEAGSLQKPEGHVEAGDAEGIKIDGSSGETIAE